MVILRMSDDPAPSAKVNKYYKALWQFDSI